MTAVTMDSSPATATAPGRTARSDPRERMIRSAMMLFRERGIEGTSFADVIEHSGAPRGSIYHHFPGGKAELAEEATRYAGDLIAGGLAAALREKDPATALNRFVENWRLVLTESEFAGCPVVAATLEGDRSPAARDRAGVAFARWQGLLGKALAARGVAPERAASVATLAIAAIEGAIVLSRAELSVAPLERVGDELERLVGEALRDGSS
jgi:TetR/AcrR family transcriptional regulator, lmrAB and yxaGH operons repressor